MLSEKEKLKMKGQALGEVKLALVGVDWDGRTLRAIRELLAEFEERETEALMTNGLSNEELHRLRGRVGMMRDLQEEVEKVWREAQEGGWRET